MRVKKFIGFFLITAITLTSCNSPYTVGKKRGYFAIDFPDKQYQTFDQPGYPYTFEYPVYAQVKKRFYFFFKIVLRIGGSMLSFLGLQDVFISVTSQLITETNLIPW